jgi:predicted transposase YdaD
LFSRLFKIHFLQQSTPEEIILAILADLEGENAEKIIIEILKKIRKFSPARASICAVQMQVLSNLRGLQNTVTKILEKMPHAIDLSKDPFFSKAFARVEAQGIAQGVAQGVAQGKAEMIAALLETNNFSLEAIANLANVPLEFVLNVQKQVNSPKKKGKSNKK